MVIYEDHGDPRPDILNHLYVLVTTIVPKSLLSWFHLEELSDPMCKA